jgi:hypothetical protein
VDFPAALLAALSWGTFDVVVYDPTTPSINHELLANALREHGLSTPIVVMDGDDIGELVAAHVHGRRN